MVELPFNYVDQIRQEEDIRIESQQNRRYEYIAYNPEAHDFFADPDIRRALGLALDRQGMIAALDLGEFATLAGGPYSPIFRNLYDPESQGPLPTDTALARQILTEKGWRPGPDGVLTKDGERFSFTILTNADNRRRVDIAQVAENQWARMGIEASIQTLEFNTTIERTQSRDFEAYIGGWGVGLSPDLYQLWGAPELPFNFVGYDNAEAQALITQAGEQPTDEAASPLWRQAAAQIVADAPYTWLFYYDTPFAVNNRLQGIEINVLSQYNDVWNWRIEE